VRPIYSDLHFIIEILDREIAGDIGTGEYDTLFHKA
jgi:hypothetical protein